MNLTLEEVNLIIKILEERRIYFESKRPDIARTTSALIGKLSKQFYK